MPPPNLLNKFRLTRNPFTDRTAEKTVLDDNAIYSRSDLTRFEPSEMTYIFFGKRGSGKTTIRLMMQRAYAEYNGKVEEPSLGHFVVDLCKPGHMTACLTDFKDAIGAKMENWDAQFQENWTSADLVDCILSYAITDLVNKITASKEVNSGLWIERLRSDSRRATQFLLLAHLYARTDASTLAFLRKALIVPKHTSKEMLMIAAPTIGLITAGAAIGNFALQRYSDRIYESICSTLPTFRNNEKWFGLVFLTGALYTSSVLYKKRQTKTRSRAMSLQSTVRVVRPKSPAIIARLLRKLFHSSDTIDSIKNMYIGESAHQKLDLLKGLVQLLGYESLAIFGDCFDEVTLLDPVRYPDSLKIFARETCRNDLLNFGRMHFFFPDSKLGLDLNTDKTLKEVIRARFDRHFVRDLIWSRHQLEDLAERRFRAAQLSEKKHLNFEEGEDPIDIKETSFSDLFRQVRGEDFSSYLSKLSTPRELMIVMSEMFGRMEAHPEEGLTAQDMEIAVTKALEQSV